MIHLVERYIGGSHSTVVDMTKMPGGELHPKLGEIEGISFLIVADTTSAEDLFALLVTHNAVKRNAPGYPIDLRIGYVPYARQDRVPNEGEALSIEAMADFINMMNFRTVEIADPHSDVTTALIKNCVVLTQEEIIKDHLMHLDFGGRSGQQKFKLNPTEWVLVCPDAGAIKKIDKLQKNIPFAGVVYMDKDRDTVTGKISRTFPRMFAIGGLQAPIEELKGKKLLVVDDICDGGYTFIQIAAGLKQYEPASLRLFITHGIFSKGTKCLIDAGYDRIYTTNAYGLSNFNIDNWGDAFGDASEQEITDTNVIRFRAIQAI